MRQLAFPQFEVPELTSEAIEFLRKHEPSEGYFVGFSGGKDSIVTLHLVKMAGVKFTAGYNATGIDHPEVVKMIKADYPEVKILHPKRTFWALLKKKPPPKRMMRWCCSLLKESQKDGSKHLVFGIRAEESHARASRGRIDVHKGKTTFKPIFNWPEWAVWEFIQAHGLKYPSLYDEGWPRVGCVICPFWCGPSKNMEALRKKSQDKYPLVWELHKKCVRHWWDNREAKPNDRFKDFEEFYADYWRS